MNIIAIFYVTSLYGWLNIYDKDFQYVELYIAHYHKDIL